MAINLALTGNIGSGKTTVSRIFEAMQIPVYCSDEKAKSFLALPKIEIEIKNYFGTSVFDSNGVLDKKALAGIVFENISKLKFLNNLIHPLVIDDYKHWLVENSEAPYTIMESAIIFENQLEKIFDKIIYVYCPQQIRMERIIQRDKTNSELVQKRFDAQLSDEEKMKHSDIIIYNDNSQALIPQVLEIDMLLKGNQ